MGLYCDNIEKKYQQIMNILIPILENKIEVATPKLI